MLELAYANAHLVSIHSHWGSETASNHIGRSKVIMATKASSTHSLRVVKMVLGSFGSHSWLEGSRSVRFSLHAWILFIQPFQLECRNSESCFFYHPPRCPECVAWSEEWLVMSQEEGSSAMGRNVMAFIPICFLLVNERIFTSAPLRIFALLSAFSFTLGITAVVCGSGKGGVERWLWWNPLSGRECSHE